MDKYTEVELLDHIVESVLIFKGISVLFSTVGAPIYILTLIVHKGLPFPTSLPTFSISPLFENSDSTDIRRYNTGFDLHSLMISDVVLSCTGWSFVCLL